MSRSMAARNASRPEARPSPAPNHARKASHVESPPCRNPASASAPSPCRSPKKRPARTRSRSGGGASLATSDWLGAAAISRLSIALISTIAVSCAEPERPSDLLRDARDHAHAGGKLFHLQPGPQIGDGVVRPGFARNLSHLDLGLAQREAGLHLLAGIHVWIDIVLDPAVEPDLDVAGFHE